MVARTDTASVSVVVVPLLGDTLSQALLLVADHPKVPPQRLVTFYRSYGGQPSAWSQ